MRVVVSGGTGYIGSEILAQCLDHPSITSVLLLTRRDPGKVAEHPKIHVVIVKDFTSYDDPTTKELQTADAALWCLGTNHGDEKVDVEYPLAFINAIKARSIESKPFRYIQLSGAFTEPPAKPGETPRSLWFFANGRRVRGVTEARVMEAAEANSNQKFEVYVVRPGGVVTDTWVGALVRYIFGDGLAANIKELGAAMVDLAVQGSHQKVFQSREIGEYVRRLQK